MRDTASSSLTQSTTPTIPVSFKSYIQLVSKNCLPPILAILLSIRNANHSMAVILGFGVLVTINWIDWFALGIQVSLNNIFICAWRQVFKGSTCFRSPMGLIIGDDNRSLSTSDTSATLGSNANNVNFFIDITINDDESAVRSSQTPATSTRINWMTMIACSVSAWRMGLP